jgi:hypothetical protein
MTVTSCTFDFKNHYYNCITRSEYPSVPYSYVRSVYDYVPPFDSPDYYHYLTAHEPYHDRYSYLSDDEFDDYSYYTSYSEEYYPYDY